MNIEELRAAYRAANADCVKLSTICTDAYIASANAYNVYSEANDKYKAALKLSLSLNAELVKALEEELSK